MNWNNERSVPIHYMELVHLHDKLQHVAAKESENHRDTLLPEVFL